jgi:O-antigen/teichoic acid export membrane protein
MIPRLYQAGRLDQLDELFKISTKWSLYISFPIFLMAVLIPGEVINALFGSNYLKGAMPLVILSLAQLVNAGTGAVGFLLIMTHHEKRWLLFASVSFLISIILDLWMIPLWGITGAALATSCGVIGLFIFALYQVRQLLGLWPYDRRYLKGCFASILTAIAILIIKLIWPTPTFINLFAIAFISMGIFWGVLLVLGAEYEEKEFLIILRHKLIHGF